VSTTLETPPRESRTGSATNTISIAIVVLLGLVALVVGVTTGGGKAGSAVLLLPPSTPTSVTVPSIDANSSLIPLGLQPDGELAVPPLSNPMQASWYDRSPTPGSLGPAVILGHVNGGGKQGIFADLGRVKAGDQVLVGRADGQTAVFTVSHVDTVPKASFPSNDVYGDTPDSELRLITCGGVLDKAAHNYLSNVIVYANLTEVRKT
jgi:sortase (surface protein transpeptidase)